MRCSHLNRALVARKSVQSNHVSKLKIWLMIVCYTGSSSMVKTQFQAVSNPKFCKCPSVFLFFGADRTGQSSVCSWSQFCPVSLLVQKQIYSLKSRLLWCSKFHVVSVTLLKVRTVRLVFQKALFGVVSPFSKAFYVPSGFIE